MATIRGRITDALIKKNKMNRSVTILSDERFPLIFKYPQGKKTQHLEIGYWYRRAYSNGSCKWKKIGKWPAMSASFVVEHMPELMMSDKKSQELVVTEWLCFADCLQWYLMHVEQSQSMKLCRKKIIHSVIKKHLLPCIGKLPLHGIRKHHIKDALILPLQAELELSSINNCLNILRAAFAQAVREERLHSSPVAHMHLADFIQKKIKPKQAALFPEMISGVFHRLRSFSPDEQMLVLFQLAHGTRIGETRMLRWRYIDWGERVIRLPASITKNAEQHDLPLTEVFIDLLIQYQAICKSGEFLFPSPKKAAAISADTANNIYRELSGGDWTSHHCRKLFRTRLTDFGVDTFVAERLINHKMNKLEETYIHTNVEAGKREALKRYHDWLCECGLFYFLSDTGARSKTIQSTDELLLCKG